VKHCALLVLAIVACDRRDPGESANAQLAAEQIASQPNGTPKTESAEPPETASSPSSPECELKRDVYVAWQRKKLTAALGPPDEEPELHAEKQAVADQELARAQERFVGACIAMGSKLDVNCFDEKRAWKGTCRPIMHELIERLMAR